MKTCANTRRKGGTNEWLIEGRAATTKEESQMKAGRCEGKLTALQFLFNKAFTLLILFLLYVFCCM